MATKLEVATEVASNWKLQQKALEQTNFSNFTKLFEVTYSGNWTFIKEVVRKSTGG